MNSAPMVQASVTAGSVTAGSATVVGATVVGATVGSATAAGATVEERRFSAAFARTILGASAPGAYEAVFAAPLCA